MGRKTQNEVWEIASNLVFPCFETTGHIEEPKQGQNVLPLGMQSKDGRWKMARYGFIAKKSHKTAMF